MNVTENVTFRSRAAPSGLMLTVLAFTSFVLCGAAVRAYLVFPLSHFPDLVSKHFATWPCRMFWKLHRMSFRTFTRMANSFPLATALPRKLCQLIRPCFIAIS